MAGHKLWQTSRATRQIGSIIDATQLMKEIFDGHENTRELQNEFGKRLAEEGIRTSGMTRADSGGHRTWMTLLKIFGLCYEDKDKVVRFTQVGRVVAKGGRLALSMMEKQILTFQYPNRTQEHFSQKVDERFRIFPYRFLVKLLLKIEYITIQEIAYFVLPVTSDKELDTVAKKIKSSREEETEIDYESHREKYKEGHDKKLYKKYIEDLAGTFKNHMEFLLGITSEKIGVIHRIYIEPDYVEVWKNKIKLFDENFKLLDTYDNQDRKFFVEKYGILPGRRKASTKTSTPVTKDQTKIRKIQDAIAEIIGEAPDRIELNKLIKRVRETTYYSVKEISKIISKYPEFIKIDYDAFEKEFLMIAGDGNRWKEFETTTNKIFKKFGFSVDHQKKIALSGDQNGFLDGYLTSGSEAGLIDCKAGKGFACSNDKVGIMKDYIKEAKKISEDKKFVFFGYVYGRKFSNFNGFDRVVE